MKLCVVSIGDCGTATGQPAASAPVPISSACNCRFPSPTKTRFCERSNVAVCPTPNGKLALQKYVATAIAFCQSIAPVSASSATNLPESVPTYNTLCSVPPTLTFVARTGCPTMPVELRLVDHSTCRLPALPVPIVVSLGLSPVRARSYPNVDQSTYPFGVGAGVGVGGVPDCAAA